MKRRGFLASLFALPAAAKAMGEVRPATQGLPDMKVMGEKWYAATSYGITVCYSCSVGPSSPRARIVTTDRMK